MTPNIVNIYRDVLLSLCDRNDTHDKFVGWLALDQEKLKKLRSLSHENLAESSVRIKKNETLFGSNANLDAITERHLSPEYIYEIKLEKNNINSGNDFVICSDWNELLSYPHYVISPIKDLFFTSQQLSFNEESTNTYYTNYLNIAKVYEFINFLSENTKSDSETIFYNRSYRFKFVLNENDLKEIIDIKTLDSLMSKDMHREAIIHLMCKEVTCFIKDIDEKDRFSHVVKNLNPLITNILHGYQSYVEDYTFDKVRKEYKEKKTEYIKKMNDTFDSVATKMFAIPAGIWFASAQITHMNQVSNYLFAKNIMVLMTIISMILVMIINIWGQRSTIIEMKVEYSEIFDELVSKFEEEKDNIKVIKKDVDIRFNRIKSYIAIAIVICVFLAIYTLVLFFLSIKW